MYKVLGPHQNNHELQLRNGRLVMQSSETAISSKLESTSKRTMLYVQ